MGTLNINTPRRVLNTPKSPIAVYNLKRDNNELDIELTVLEHYYLRLYMHNLTNKEISDFLEINIDELYLFKCDLKAKFKSQNLTELLVKAFRGKFLIKDDYLNDVVKKEALKLAQEIISDFFDIPNNSTLYFKLRESVLDFHSSYKVKFYESNNKLKSARALTKSELNYIRVKAFNFKNNKEIKDELGLVVDKSVEAIQRSIYTKLGVNNWFNVFLICYQLGFFKSSCYFKTIENESHTCVKKIIHIKENLKEISLKQKQLYVYTELLAFFGEVSFSCLLND
ncbi:hypothetical protein [Flavivirga sp. 57AJ16]|uniref:hypothetical protein n=1 Tax=Flavivirga sp. 57AJ16 TaxID=3025307 RepID=UPI002366F020|nr:hypothetical protein [Flavivirga sp. 57AJ16]MDD7886225.1 hypothetical protein [Flavivirga sp. 57AJ16]